MMLSQCHISHMVAFDVDNYGRMLVKSRLFTWLWGPLLLLCDKWVLWHTCIWSATKNEMYSYGDENDEWIL